MAPVRPVVVQRLTKLPAVGPWFRNAHDRWLNRHMRRHWQSRMTIDARIFDAQPPVLTTRQQRIVDELATSGLAIAEWRDVFDSDDLWRSLVELAESWASRAPAERAARSGKDYIRMLHSDRGVLRADDVLARVGISRMLLDVANSYMQRAARLYQADIWHTVLDTGGKAPRGSQLWHRDPEDLKVLKVFAYVRAVGTDAGPLEYVRSSRLGERYGDLSPQQLPYGNQASDADVTARVRPDDIQRCAYPAGTLVFVDTAGLHRGGRALTDERLFAVWTYVTDASPRRSFITIDRSSLPTDLDPVVSMALGQAARP